MEKDSVSIIFSRMPSSGLGVDRVRGASARAFAIVRVCPGAFACVPEALCRWDWRRKSVSLGLSRGRFAWQAWGIVEHVRVRSMVDVHFAFAWQAWGFRCMSPLGRALGGGSAWQAW